MYRSDLDFKTRPKVSLGGASRKVRAAWERRRLGAGRGRGASVPPVGRQGHPPPRPGSHPVREEGWWGPGPCAPASPRSYEDAESRRPFTFRWWKARVQGHSVSFRNELWILCQPWHLMVTAFLEFSSVVGGEQDVLVLDDNLWNWGVLLVFGRMFESKSMKIILS